MPENISQATIEFPEAEDATFDHFYVNRLISDVQHDLRQNRKKLLRITSSWLDLFKWLQEFEAEVICGKDPLAREQKFYEGTLSNLKGLGILLLEKLRSKEEVPLEEGLGVTYEDVKACVDELVYQDQSIHSDMTEGRKQSIGDLLKGDAERTT